MKNKYFFLYEKSITKETSTSLEKICLKQNIVKQITCKQSNINPKT